MSFSTAEKVKATEGIVSDVPVGNVERGKKVHEYLTRINEHVNDKADRPKVKDHCGTCLVFGTPFCVWEYQGYDKETMKALHVDRNALACSSHFPFKLRAMYEPAWQKRERKMSFSEKVENL